MDEFCKELKPCPYVSWTDNEDVSWFIKKFDDHFDFILMKDGKPDRCFQFKPPLTVMQTGGELDILRRGLEQIANPSLPDGVEAWKYLGGKAAHMQHLAKLALYDAESWELKEQAKLKPMGGQNDGN